MSMDTSMGNLLEYGCSWPGCLSERPSGGIFRIKFVRKHLKSNRLLCARIRRNLRGRDFDMFSSHKMFSAGVKALHSFKIVAVDEGLAKRSLRVAFIVA
jgi:hypothetical protein